MLNDRIGFSTGALEKGDFRKAIGWINEHRMREVELSALRFDELEPLVSALNTLDITNFKYLSFHAPTSFSPSLEQTVINLLQPVFNRGWNIVVHPDIVFRPSLWRRFRHQLLIENMDRRKFTGRTVAELQGIFGDLPDARLCLDIAHARQMDTTLSLLRSLVASFKNRIAEIHISELDSRCRHLPLSSSAVEDYHRFAPAFYNIPIIIESMLPGVEGNQRAQEIELVHRAIDQIS